MSRYRPPAPPSSRYITPEGYRRGDAALAMYFELAAARVRVAV